MTAISHESILRDGPHQAINLDGLDHQLVRDIYRFMERLRRCEEALIEEYHPADQMRCPVHFCVGQEAVPAALATLIQPNDLLFSHHRTHGYYLAKGGGLRPFFAEMYGRSTGANGGKAGSQDISVGEIGFFGGAILAGAVSIAAGAAMSFQLKGMPNVAITGFGEGASDEGAFWETINYAAVRKLPIVFLCENNHYATYSPQPKRQSEDNLAERVKAFGVQSRALFGNDAMAVQKAIAEAMEHARSGQGPYLIEAYTYRWNGHVGPEDDDYIGYRPIDELEFWQKHCPIALLKERMSESGLLDPQWQAQVISEIETEIHDAFEFAKNSPFPNEIDWVKANYSASTPTADRLLKDLESADFNQDQATLIPRPY